MLSNRLMPVALGALALLAATCATAKFPWARTGQTTSAVEHAEVSDYDSAYDRSSARVMARSVARPTRANLDFAAYHANVMLHAPAAAPLPPPAGSAPGPDALFDGVLVPGSVVAELGQTPISADERRRPLAYSPLVDYLTVWSYDKSSALDDARSAVRAETWGRERNVQLTYQEITLAYLHQAEGGETQLWVEIEFQPWAELFPEMPDGDGDGHAEVYGQLRPGLINAEVLARIQEDYVGRLLETDEVKTWTNELASYWYPSYNTDVYDLGDHSAWPNPDTEPEVRAAFGDLLIDEPTVIIRGKPHGEPIYNLFAIAGMRPIRKAATSSSASAAPAELSPRGPDHVTAMVASQIEQIDAELKAQGGDWGKWAKQVAPAHKQVRKLLKSRPAKVKALMGSDDFLFFRNSLDYVVGGDLRQQPAGKDPFAAIVEFKQLLASHGVDFLLVPVPTKAEVFPDKLLGGKHDLAALPVLNPYGRKLMRELGEADVEVVDLLPAMLAARAQRTEGQEPLYQPQDTHWTDRGLQLAARLVAERIKQYAWYAELGRAPVTYTTKQAPFNHPGDLVSRLAEKDKARFKPMSLIGTQVINPDGSPYDDDVDSPVVVLGDSFTGVYQRTQCRNAGVSAHLARELSHPVDLVMSYGGGPNVRKTLLRRGTEDLGRRRLVVWMFAARDLYNYWEDWASLPTDKPQE